MSSIRRPIRRMPSMFGSREIVHLACLCGFLIVLLLSLGKVRDPKSWYWLWGMAPNDAGVALDAEPLVYPPVDQDEKIIIAPPQGQGSEGLAGQEPSSFPLDSSPELRATFNPLGLKNTHECQGPDPSLLEVVKDDVVPGIPKRKRLSQEVMRIRREEAKPAIYQLLAVAACTQPKKIKAMARRDVDISNLLQDPDTYRGRLIHVSGVLLGLYIEREGLSEKNRYGIEKVYRAWIQIPERRVNLIVFFTKLPEGLEVGMERENISIDAFFLRLYANRAQDGKWYASPLLLGYEPHWQKIGPSPFLEEAIYWSIGLICVSLLVLVIVWWHGVRENRLAKQLRASVGPPPTLVADFLSESLSESAGETLSGSRESDERENVFSEGADFRSETGDSQTATSETDWRGKRGKGASHDTKTTFGDVGKDSPS